MEYDNEGVIKLQKTKEIMKEEKVFLRLCGELYRQKIMKREAFSINEFQKLLFVITTLELWNYMNYFLLEVYPQEMIVLGDYLLSKPEEENSKNGLYAKKDCQQRWLREFWEQIPVEAQKEMYKDIFIKALY